MRPHSGIDARRLPISSKVTVGIPELENWMTDVHKIAKLSISTHSTDPPRGIVEIDTANSTIRLELNEDVAHGLCTGLERFLTQVPHRARNRSRCG